MSRMSVSKKLVLGFSIVAFLGCLSSALSIIYLNILDRDIEILSKEAMPNITDLGEMRREVLTMRMALREMRNPLYDRTELESFVREYQRSQQEYLVASRRVRPDGSGKRPRERVVKAETDLFA